METPSGYDVLHRRVPAINGQIEIQDLLPHRYQKDCVTLLAGVFLCDLQFESCIRLLQPAKQGRYWLTHLKVDWAVLDLHQHVIIELAVQRVKDVVRCARAIRLRIGPVEVMVVNKRTVEDHSAMWLQRSRNYIGGFRWIAFVNRRTQLTLGIRLDDHTAEIRYLPVNFVELLHPPISYLRIERVERLQSTYLLGHTDVHCYTELHAISSKHIANPRQL